MSKLKSIANEYDDYINYFQNMDISENERRY